MSSESTPVQRLGGDPPSPYEELYGYSRVVDTGQLVFIAGTTSVDPTGFIVGTTPYEQAVEVFRKLVHELGRVGLGPESVVQVRMYVTDISRADEVGRAHGEALGSASGGGPAASMVEVSGLVDPRMLVEVELTALRS